MADENTSSGLFRKLVSKQRLIMAEWQHVWDLSDSPPGSLVPWPRNRLPYAYAEFSDCIEGSAAFDRTNPYPQYDEWLLPRCGPDGYIRAGDIVGIRDQGKAKEFLRWVLPDADENTLKINLARMIAKIPFASSRFDRTTEAIGDDLLYSLTAVQIAALAVRIWTYGQQVGAEIEEDIRAEAEDIIA